MKTRDWEKNWKELRRCLEYLHREMMEKADTYEDPILSKNEKLIRKGRKLALRDILLLMSNITQQ